LGKMKGQTPHVPTVRYLSSYKDTSNRDSGVP
jgi:hypothetical protein